MPRLGRVRHPGLTTQRQGRTMATTHPKADVAKAFLGLALVLRLSSELRSATNVTSGSNRIWYAPRLGTLLGFPSKVIGSVGLEA